MAVLAATMASAAKSSLSSLAWYTGAWASCLVLVWYTLAALLPQTPTPTPTPHDLPPLVEGDAEIGLLKGTRGAAAAAASNADDRWRSS